MPFQEIAAHRLYQQVAEQIAGLIRRGELAPGARLPAERDLAQRLRVSRPVLREAMIALEIAGLVEVRMGAGAFVARRAPMRRRSQMPAQAHSPSSPPGAWWRAKSQRSLLPPAHRTRQSQSCAG